ncbi:MAG: helix-turn-helix transcriptional regulator [Actinomycetaceae bacterium]|nr:helix-turn-helix transcriptional regulator [Actinomycetaceae bacterium]
MATTTYVISVAAQLAGMHPQTLRQYDRLGIVIPARTKGRGRRYTPRDVERLREVQRLSQDEGINLEGIRRILELESQLDHTSEQLAALRREVESLRNQLEKHEERRDRVFAASAQGDVLPLRRGRRASMKRQGGELVHVPRPGALVRIDESGSVILLPRNNR